MARPRPRLRSLRPLGPTASIFWMPSITDLYPACTKSVSNSRNIPLFQPDMMASAEAMRAAMQVLEPELKKQGAERPVAGTVVLGTTQGDIHEIGKTLVGTLLTAHGFKVYDLGVDVPSDKFAMTALEVGADIVGVSALLTTTMRGQRNVIAAIERQGLRSRVKIVVGGAPVTRRWAEEIGADGYGKDAVAAVTLMRGRVRAT